MKISIFRHNFVILKGYDAPTLKQKPNHEKDYFYPTAEHTVWRIC